MGAWQGLLRCRESEGGPEPLSRAFISCGRVSKAMIVETLLSDDLKHDHNGLQQCVK